jgi:hypothetical protein
MKSSEGYGKTPGSHDVDVPGESPRVHPGSFRSHLLPRTRAGWIGVLSFLLIFAFVEPPLVYSLGNRIEPWVLGFPFLYTYLLVLYGALIGVLLWAQRRRL